MTSSPEDRPVLLLDVDGVINVYQGRDDVFPPFAIEVYSAVSHLGSVFTLWLRPELREWFASLSERFTIVWATDWLNANEAISPLLGLPGDLDAVPFPEQWLDVPFWFCRKTPHVRRWASTVGVRRFAWIDDTLTEADAETLAWDTDPKWATSSRAWQLEIAETSPVRPEDVLLLPTDPSVGITADDVDRLLDFAR